MSILNELLGKLELIEHAKWDAIAKSKTLEEGLALQPKIEEFELRIDQLFDELKLRLRSILTSSQLESPSPTN